jgi:protein TonB
MNSGRAIRAGRTGLPAAELDRTNLVPFARRGEASARGAPEVLVAPADRPIELFARQRARLVALIVFSAAAHAALYLPFAREPEPMASLGEVVISAEIVIGTNAPAGPADEQGQAQASAPEPAKTPEPVLDPPDPALAQAEPPKPETAVTQSEPARPETAPAEPPADTQRAPTAPTPVAVLPEPVQQPSVEPLVPVEQVAPPEAKAAAATPNPAPPKQIARPPPKNPEKPKADARRASLAGAPNDARSTAPPAASAAGAGRGRSDADSNYAGLVAAHLARFKQFPPDARGRGDQGRATVTFSLSGGGGVTAVRLARGTGVASLDAEATAMVRRASPFPPPPHGRPVSFTVPVSFRLN